jgi:hypothetical protein
MSQLNKTQLEQENQSSFPNNNNGFITPTLLRQFNTDIIDTEIYKTDIGGANYEYGGTAGFQSGTTTTQYATVNSKLLNEIFFPNGKIVFVRSPNRADGLGRSLD